MAWSDAITAVSAAVAAASFVSGVAAWRREFVGKRRIELTQSVLALFYEAEDAIASIRHPFSFASEGKTRERRPDERPEESDALDQAWVAFERYQKREQLFSQIQSMRYQFMATFGPDTAAPFGELNAVVNEILLAARQLGTRYWQDRHRVPMNDDEWKSYLAQVEKLEAVFWQVGEDDLIAKRVKAAVAQLEAIAKREVETVRRRRLFSRKSKPPGS